jgi:hypothetical protein
MGHRAVLRALAVSRNPRPGGLARPPSDISLSRQSLSSSNGLGRWSRPFNRRDGDLASQVRRALSSVGLDNAEAFRRLRRQLTPSFRERARLPRRSPGGVAHRRRVGPHFHRKPPAPAHGYRHARRPRLWPQPPPRHAPTWVARERCLPACRCRVPRSNTHDLSDLSRPHPTSQHTSAKCIASEPRLLPATDSQTRNLAAGWHHLKPPYSLL